MKFQQDIDAQLTVMGVMMLFLTILVLAALMPTIVTYCVQMADNFTAAGFPLEALLTKMIPLFMIVSFLSTIALYAAPMTR